MRTRPSTLSVSEFKAKCLRILEDLGPAGIIILKRGRPLARVTRVPSGSNERLIGSMRGKIAVKGDLLSTGVRWDAQS